MPHFDLALSRPATRSSRWGSARWSVAGTAQHFDHDPNRTPPFRSTAAASQTRQAGTRDRGRRAGARQIEREDVERGPAHTRSAGRATTRNRAGEEKTMVRSEGEQAGSSPPLIVMSQPTLCVHKGAGERGCAPSNPLPPFTPGRRSWLSVRSWPGPICAVVAHRAHRRSSSERRCRTRQRCAAPCRSSP